MRIAGMPSGYYARFDHPERPNSSSGPRLLSSLRKRRELAGEELRGAADMDGFKELHRSDCGNGP